MLRHKKFFALILSVLMLFLFGSSIAFAAYYDDNTGDSWDDAYIINSAEDLELMRDRFKSKNEIETKGKYYKLNSDIEISKTSWIPIGQRITDGSGTRGMYFNGHFDGQNHTINLNIDNIEGSGYLFSEISVDIDEIAVKNLKITGNIRAYRPAAFVSSLRNGIIENCSCDCIMENEYTDNGIGGIVYTMENGIIRNCYVNVKILSNGKAGGIVHVLYSGDIENCTINQGSEISGDCAGGIASLTYGGSITNCKVNATINSNTYVGGIVGFAFNTPILRSNIWPSQYVQIGNESSNNEGFNNDIQDTYNETTEKLHVATVEPIPEEYKTDDLLQKLADNASISRSNIQWLSADVINTAEPPEPTTKMREQVKSDGYEFVAKLNTIKVSEDGYYAFMVTVSDDLVGTKVSDLRLYYAEPSDFLAGTDGSVEPAFALMPLINGVTGGLEVSNFFGVKLDTLPKQFLATMFLSASKSMTVYIVKILLMLLGGCNIGFGVLGISVGGLLIWKLYKRHS